MWAGGTCYYSDKITEGGKKTIQKRKSRPCAEKANTLMPPHYTEIEFLTILHKKKTLFSPLIKIY